MTVTGINLPTPQILETLNFDAVFAELVADFQQRHPGFDALLYSDPAIKLLEVAAYREVLLRQRVNDAFKATLLGLAEGTDLDNLADFYDVARATGETDVALRSRVIERIKGSSTAGGAAWYRYQALTADDRVRDALVTSPDAGQVSVAILSEEGQQIPVQRLVELAQLAAREVISEHIGSGGKPKEAEQALMADLQHKQALEQQL